MFVVLINSDSRGEIAEVLRQIAESVSHSRLSDDFGHFRTFPISKSENVASVKFFDTPHAYRKWLQDSGEIIARENNPPRTRRR